MFEQAAVNGDTQKKMQCRRDCMSNILFNTTCYINIHVQSLIDYTATEPHATGTMNHCRGEDRKKR
jgi:hypothetical protein